MNESEHIKQAQSDHDLLTRIDEKLNMLITNQGITNTDHEVRLRRLEMWGAVAIGLMYALQFYVNFIKQ